MVRIIIVDVGVEGGGATVYGRETDGVWSFWNEGSWMYMDENDDDRWRQSASEPVAELLAALPDDWSAMYPLRVHPDFVSRIRAEYERCRRTSPGGRGERSRHERWRELFADSNPNA